MCVVSLNDASVTIFLALFQAVLAAVLWRFHCEPWALINITHRHNMHGKGTVI